MEVMLGGGGRWSRVRCYIEAVFVRRIMGAELRLRTKFRRGRFKTHITILNGKVLLQWDVTRKNLNLRYKKKPILT